MFLYFYFAEPLKCKFIIAQLLLLCLTFAFGQTISKQDNADTATSILHFTNVVGNNPLNFDSTYSNFFGESFTVTKFRTMWGHPENLKDLSTLGCKM